MEIQKKKYDYYIFINHIIKEQEQTILNAIYGEITIVLFIIFELHPAILPFLN
jgi:hypothetical protein